MTPLSSFTYRNWLIALHDALATTFAVIASFYLRFEGEPFLDRLPLLLRSCPTSSRSASWSAIFSI